MKHNLTIIVKILDYWFDYTNNKVYILCQTADKMELMERDLK